MSVHLPPLPPTGSDDRFRPGGRSVADIVDAEHRQLAELVRRLTAPGTEAAGGADTAGGADAAGATRAADDALSVLTAALSRHLSAEEQYLLPAVRAALPDAGDRVDATIDADAALLAALKGLPADGLGDVAARVHRHVEEVGALVAALRGAATPEELIRLGNRLEIAEEAAPTRPHPGTPATPPWNRIVEPAVGVVDKLRDAVTGRPTYLRDLTEPSAGDT
ncbi:hemerythrin domain-containing protein [Micromonospora endolithica]|uniref:Hemerythrin domain-containing protein n=1 Tax=Micromonospora endolithica TaxID=230091 RepID=A0A3A9ZK20_9ACTN|nr:hemerythrin domain-containing protein [Micromonospora endolithica]RKN48652.1 hemerythrin domain-containing protein [Micromonospora endolithica]TWJ22009.1 hemerythrin HHE cation binding domain-containing protein [Micromonospora endolithica]